MLIFLQIYFVGVRIEKAFLIFNFAPYMQKILVIQTSFIGDVVLATALVEKLAAHFPKAEIDFLVRKGNESLLLNNPHLNEILVWNKKEHKLKNLFSLLSTIRKKQYDKVINLQRFLATGILTAFSNAGETMGFDKNPMSRFFNKKFKHEIGNVNKHEVERNNELIAAFTDKELNRPRLYPSANDFEKVSVYDSGKYVTMTPGSVWFTKQYPFENWLKVVNAFPAEYKIYLLGGKENTLECESLQQQSSNNSIIVLAGKLTFLESAALMKNAVMNYVNDSAPLHFASAVNAPVTAIFCSTVPSFGFTPLSDTSTIIETLESLPCRPCGLHGHKACPEKHFKCGLNINPDRLIGVLDKANNN
jgi:heptosyltransferase II